MCGHNVVVFSHAKGRGRIGFDKAVSRIHLKVSTNKSYPRSKIWTPDEAQNSYLMSEVFFCGPPQVPRCRYSREWLSLRDRPRTSSPNFFVSSCDHCLPVRFSFVKTFGLLPFLAVALLPTVNKARPRDPDFVAQTVVHFMHKCEECWH
jgi:hypothetical protein